MRCGAAKSEGRERGRGASHGGCDLEDTCDGFQKKLSVNDGRGADLTALIGTSMGREDIQSEGRAKPVRVLLVEDEFVVSMTLKLQLESNGYDVVGTARTAQAGIELACELRPDVVLMDIGLPDTDGVEATKAIMQSAPTNVIVVTAYGDHRVQDALDAGARLVLAKPILEEQLEQAIARVAGEGPGGANGREGEE